jgi:hypothetical protein
MRSAPRKAVLGATEAPSRPNIVKRVMKNETGTSQRRPEHEGERPPEELGERRGDGGEGAGSQRNRRRTARDEPVGDREVVGLDEIGDRRVAPGGTRAGDLDQGAQV